MKEGRAVLLRFERPRLRSEPSTVPRADPSRGPPSRREWPPAESFPGPGPGVSSAAGPARIRAGGEPFPPPRPPTRAATRGPGLANASASAARRSQPHPRGARNGMAPRRTAPRSLDSLQRRLDRIPNARAEVKTFENGPPLDAPIAMRIVGDDLDSLRFLAAELERMMAANAPSWCASGAAPATRSRSMAPPDRSCSIGSK